MKLTKDIIIDKSLALFAERGYYATSVSDIAAALNASKGAIYKHFLNKRAVFDGIVEKMTELDSKAANAGDMPDKRLCDGGEYGGVTFEKIKTFTLERFGFWTKCEFAVNFRKMLSHERFRDKEINDLYESVLLSGVIDYLTDAFAALIAKKQMKETDAYLAAVKYYSPMYALIEASEADGNGKAETLEKIIDDFISENGLA